MQWSMFARATALAVDKAQKHQLKSLARAGTTPQRTARKCQVILLASQGVFNHAIAQQTGLSRPTILAVRAAFGRRGIAALQEPQKRKRSRRALTPELEQKILDTTLKPDQLTVLTGVSEYSPRSWAFSSSARSACSFASRARPA